MVVLSAEFFTIEIWKHHTASKCSSIIICAKQGSVVFLEAVREVLHLSFIESLVPILSGLNGTWSWSKEILSSGKSCRFFLFPPSWWYFVYFWTKRSTLMFSHHLWMLYTESLLRNFAGGVISVSAQEKDKRGHICLLHIVMPSGCLCSGKQKGRWSQRCSRTKLGHAECWKSRHKPISQTKASTIQ